MDAVITIEVMNDLKRFLEENIQNVRLSTKENTNKVPSVVLGYLDPLQEEREEKDDFPYILIRCLEGSEDEESSIRLKIIFGIYSEDVKGWMDVLHLIQVVKLAILKKKIFEFYSVITPLKFSIPEEQPYPYFFGFMDVSFEVPHIEMEGMVNAWQAE